MTTSLLRQLQWMSRVVVCGETPVQDGELPAPTARERLIAGLVAGPRTVAQLAQAFGLSRPTVLEQVRRAVRDGLIVEVEVAEEEKRFASERYYALTVPAIRQHDRDLLMPTIQAVARDLAASLRNHEGDLQAAFVMTHLARDGWELDDLWPYLNDAIFRIVTDVAETNDVVMSSVNVRSHGLAWVEDGVETATGAAIDRLEESA